MTWIDAGLALLRLITYAGSIAAAGGVFFCFSLPNASDAVRNSVRWQVIAGCILILIAEPLRALLAQIAMAGGDWSRAFEPDLRWLALQMPSGQAGAVRLAAALTLLASSHRSAALRLPVALAMPASFLLEGHTAGDDVGSALLSVALFVHLAAVHWWIGALYPLLSLVRASNTRIITETIEAFSRQAVIIVAVLAIAGGVLLGVLTGISLRAESPYQIRFLLKLILVAALLSLAAWNKFRLTPLLTAGSKAGPAALEKSIRIEITIAALVLSATVWATATSPDD